MARIAIEDVKAWVEDSKLKPQALDLDHLSQLEEEVLARLASIYDTSIWVDKSTTPRLVQTIIAKYYTAWLYNKFYSENQSQPNLYAMLVTRNAETLVSGILDGTITVPGAIESNAVDPSFYPNDASSIQDPTLADPSLGPARFSLGKTF